MVTINITVKKTARYLLTPLALYLFSLSHCLPLSAINSSGGADLRPLSLRRS